MERDQRDPWGLLGMKLSSKHCAGRTAEVVSYDHTGSVSCRCECGKEYEHDEGHTK